MLFPATVSAQSGWFPQQSGTTNNLRGVSFTDANTGTAVGNVGTILRTTNGGATWTSQSSGTTNHLTGVSFTDANTGTAVGEFGTILRTTNGGATWTSQAIGMYTTLYGVSFTDANTGTAVGLWGTICRTTNGGATWTSQTSGTTEVLTGVSFTDGNIGTAVGTIGTILRTTNGGATWTSQISGTERHLYGVSFYDADTGTAVGAWGTICRTTNRGATWTSQTSGTMNSFYGASFTDANTGTAVGTIGTILRTTNGGATWASQISGATNHLTGVSFTDANIGTAVGEVGRIIRTTTGGVPPTLHGLVAYYPFSGNANDSSGNGHHGMPNNSPPLISDRFGHASSAYHFDGINQCIDLPSSIRITADLSISFWVQTTIVDNSNWPNARFIIDRDICGSARDWSVGLGLGGKVQFQTGAGTSDHVLTSSVDVNEGSWHHVVIIRDSSAYRKRIYIDGRLDTTSTFDGQQFLNNSETICIAATVCQPSLHKYYPGTIDDIRLYRRALAVEDVQLLYHERGWPLVAHLTSTSPVRNQLNVGTDANISVTFDANMNAATLNDSTFVVHGRSTGRHSGVISYNNISRTATFNPVRDFAVGEPVTVVLTAGIRSVYGVPLDKAHSIQFTATVHQGSGQFAVDSSYSFGVMPDYCVSADFDNDGDLDIANTYRTSGLVSVLLNNGDASFVRDSNYSVGSTPMTVFAADLDGDGDIDLATQNSISSGTVRILLNNGTGLFSVQPSFSAHGNQPGSVFLSDVDNDGDVDLIIGNADPSLSIFLNNGSAQFAFSANYSVGGGASVHAGDLDNDGDVDLTGGIWTINRIFVLKNRGDGTFDSLSTHQVGSRPAFVTAADLNADGYLDLSSTNHYDSSASVLLNNGNGTFGPPATYRVGVAQYVAVSADLDHDGDLDLTVPNRENDDISVLLNNGNGTFAAQHRYPCGDGPVFVMASDFDGDGDLDLATTNSNSNAVVILLNQGPTGVEPTPPTLPSTFAIAQNYPNPFNPTTTITYQIPIRSHVMLKVYDVLGREVVKLVDGVEEPGYKSVQWTSRGLASGVYFYRLEAGDFVETRKLALLR
jgi:photosystem II stability/assembly factor-like uncharacterized protein